MIAYKRKLSSWCIHKLMPQDLCNESLPVAIQYLSSFLGSCEKEKALSISPIFILSAGWRSGSTLLQRLISSDTSILLWGEPYDDRIPIPRLSSTVADFCSDDPSLKYCIDTFSGEFSKKWIANLNPGPRQTQKAHRAYFDHLFGIPAKERGFQRWGAKFVRLTAYHAMYLKWIFPNAKFIFLLRNPLKSYNSYRGNQWFSVRPSFKMDNIFKFMAHWAFLAESFVQESEQLDALLIKYEDLISNSDTITKIEKYLGISINHDILNLKIGVSQKSDKSCFRYREKLICRLLTGSLCRQLGYDL